MASAHGRIPDQHVAKTGPKKKKKKKKKKKEADSESKTETETAPKHMTASDLNRVSRT